MVINEYFRCFLQAEAKSSNWKRLGFEDVFPCLCLFFGAKVKSKDLAVIVQ